MLEFKLDGVAAQYAALDDAIRATQFIRNKCVRLWVDGRSVKLYDLNKYCAVLAKEHDFAAKLNSQARQAAAERAGAAILRFYKNCRAKKPGKKGYPRFQKDCRSVEYKQTGWKLDERRTRLTLTDGFKAGTFRLRGTRDLLGYALGQIKRVRILKRADGYYAQFGLDAQRRVVIEPSGASVGIDLGLTHFYTDSSGATVEHPRPLQRSERALKHLQRRVWSKVKGSQNRAKARGRLGRKHLKVGRQRRQRRDFAVKTARALVMSNDVIAYEDLTVANLLKNRRLATSISDAGWRAFVTWLSYLAHVYGKVAVAVPPRYTSQDCSGCVVRGFGSDVAKDVDHRVTEARQHVRSVEIVARMHDPRGTGVAVAPHLDPLPVRPDDPDQTAAARQPQARFLPHHGGTELAQRDDLDGQVGRAADIAVIVRGHGLVAHVGRGGTEHRLLRLVGQRQVEASVGAVRMPAVGIGIDPQRQVKAPTRLIMADGWRGYLDQPPVHQLIVVLVPRQCGEIGRRPGGAPDVAHAYALLSCLSMRSLFSSPVADGDGTVSAHIVAPGQLDAARDADARGLDQRREFS